MAVDNFNSRENFNEIGRVREQVQQELRVLKRTTFYSLSADENSVEVEYDLPLVQEYLTSLKNKSRTELTQKNTSVRIMAMQIALESMGYNAGKIDGIFTNPGSTSSKTKDAIKKFQQNNGLKADGLPGRNTIVKILEKL
jgi:peptidoglycan hydrolase-like protein with peptidoglycan-binding domain